MIRFGHAPFPQNAFEGLMAKVKVHLLARTCNKKFNKEKKMNVLYK